MEIYVYFLHFDPNKPREAGRPKAQPPAAAEGTQTQTQAKQEA